MELTPARLALIDAHVAETRRLMLDYAFELNDLVRYAISASREKNSKVYYPMDPVHDAIRQWHEFGRKLDRLAADVARTRQRLGTVPFEAEGPASGDV